VVVAMCSVLAACAEQEERPLSLNKQGQMRSVESSNGEVLEAYDNGDGTFSFETPEGFDPEALVDKGVFTWEYVRQGRFPNERQMHWDEQTFTYEGPSELTVYDRFDRTERYDREGRVWRIQNIDQRALEAQWAGFEAEAAADALIHPEPVGEIAEQVKSSNEEPDYAIGEVVTWKPTSWTEPCDSGHTQDSHVWDTDDRNKLTGSLSDRQRASVVIATGSDTNGPWFWSCSGVQVGVHWVMTAAHCVTTVVNPARTRRSPTDG
jgi:hypothetical protein